MGSLIDKKELVKELLKEIKHLRDQKKAETNSIEQTVIQLEIDMNMEMIMALNYDPITIRMTKHKKLLQ